LEAVDTISDVRYETVLFDLDGTLIDSAAIILASFRHATQTVLERQIPAAELLAAVGGSTLHDQMRAFGDERVDELVRAYCEHNEPLHADLRVCEGVIDVLERLDAEGRRLGIVTSKRRLTVELAFRALPELRGHFDVVVGSEDTTLHKPAPDPVVAALERLGRPAAGAAYVGDSPFDVQAAKAAGVAAIAVTWGGIHSRERLAREDPDSLADSAEELLVRL
jgi:pyrophosphatase PpaX